MPYQVMATVLQRIATVFRGGVWIRPNIHKTETGAPGANNNQGARDQVRLTISASENQTSDIEDWTDYNQNVLASVSAAGNFTTQQLVGTGPFVNNLTAGAITIPAAGMINGMYKHQNTGASADTLDTAANIVAAIPNCQVNSQFEFYLRNTGSGTITVTTNTGLTLDGTMTIPATYTGFFVCIVTAVGAGLQAVTVFHVGNTVH